MIVLIREQGLVELGLRESRCCAVDLTSRGRVEEGDDVGFDSHYVAVLVEQAVYGIS